MMGFGCIPRNIKDKVVNSTVLIEPSKVVILEKDKKYGGVDTKGNILIPVAFDGIYSVISAGQTSYYLLYNEQEYDALEYIRLIKEQLGIVDEEENDNQENTNTEQDTNTTENNETNTNVEQSNVENTNSENVSNVSENTENNAE